MDDWKKIVQKSKTNFFDDIKVSESYWQTPMTVIFNLICLVGVLVLFVNIHKGILNFFKGYTYIPLDGLQDNRILSCIKVLGGNLILFPLDIINIGLIFDFIDLVTTGSKLEGESFDSLVRYWKFSALVTLVEGVIGYFILSKMYPGVDVLDPSLEFILCGMFHVNTVIINFIDIFVVGRNNKLCDQWEQGKKQEKIGAGSSKDFFDL